MKEFEKSAMFAMLDQLEAQLQLVSSQVRTIRGLMYHVGEERPQPTPQPPAKSTKQGTEEYLGEDDEAAIERMIEEQRQLGLAEAERVTKEWEVQRAMIEREENTL